MLISRIYKEIKNNKRPFKKMPADLTRILKSKMAKK